MRFVTCLTLISFVFVFAIYQANAEPYIVIEAEDFDAKKGDTFQILTPQSL
jgi:hypothetical protein